MFKVKTEYLLKLLILQMWRLLGRSEVRKCKNKNRERILNAAIIILVHSNFVNSMHQERSKCVYKQVQEPAVTQRCTFQ